MGFVPIEQHLYTIPDTSFFQDPLQTHTHVMMLSRLRGFSHSTCLL